jgi:hypothetical protein
LLNIEVVLTGHPGFLMGCAFYAPLTKFIKRQFALNFFLIF